jgi:integrase/recombinase XerD
VLPYYGKRFISTTSSNFEFENKRHVFKAIGGGKEYAEVLVNGKTGSRHLPLIQSLPYVKDWLSNHLSRNNPNSPLFVDLGRNSMGKQLNSHGLYGIYKEYKEVFFQVVRRSNCNE